MSNKEKVDLDLREYLLKAENMRNEDKMNHLRALFDKYFTFRLTEHYVTKHDLYQLISDAKSQYVNLPLNPEISGKRVDKTDLTSIAVMEAFILYLNKNNLLKKLVKFDYTDSSHEYNDSNEE